MLWNKALSFFLFCMLIFNSLFSQPNSTQIALFIVKTSKDIITQSPDLIKSLASDKVYLDEERISFAWDYDYGYYLALDNGEYLYTPLVLLDDNGPFLPTSYNILARGLFKNICNNCGHVWEKGGIVIWCPKCGSTNIQSNVPNW